MSNSTAEIRQKFLDFFKSKGHQIVESSSLVPHNDPTLLFTNAGMNQFKDVFLGAEKRSYCRATTAQRCVRAGGKHNDLENVGYTARHHTFFEMLGNFSFGDYFKQEAIRFAWELLTGEQWFNLPKEKLLVTVYETDDEAYNIWHNEIGMPADKIIRIGDNKGAPFASDNFWQMGDTGPCGPCTEIFYDHGEHIWGGPPGSPEEDGDRYIEIWNIVFMQFNRQLDGSMERLPKPSVDTGMGLERIAAVIQHVNSNYDIDLFKKLILATAQITGTTDLENKSLRVIADHIRSCAYLIADGVMPSNEGRGYVLRRIIRRAVRHGHKLGSTEVFFYKLVAPLIDVMQQAAVQLKQQQTLVEQVLKNEEEQFAKTLERGLSLLDDELSQLKGKILNGKIAFKLYDTYGFPLDLIADICREREIKVDEIEFESAMEEQRRRARDAGGFSVDYNTMIKTDATSHFCGYEQDNVSAKVTAIFKDGQQINQLQTGEEATVILDQTAFYAESGGQTGDSGWLKNDSGMVFIVKDTQKFGQSIGHIGHLMQGNLSLNQTVDAIIDSDRRNRTRLNHSATHLLHAALRDVLGKHVTQKGSLVSDRGLRFDFSHFEAMKLSQLRDVENIVNRQIRANLAITTQIMPIEKAKETGAMALFGEKYEDTVRVLKMGDFSIELCGGTHASRTGDIGLFRLVSESGIASGVRRIEAITGEIALNSLHMQDDLLQTISGVLKTDTSTLVEKANSLVERNKSLEKEVRQFKDQQAAQASTSLLDQVIVVNGYNVLVCQLTDVEPKMLRTMVDDMKNKMKSGVIVFAVVNSNNKINIIAGVTSDLTNLLKAGDIVNRLASAVGGKGGGRADMAQAGGEDVSALPDALNSIRDWIMNQL